MQITIPGVPVTLRPWCLCALTWIVACRPAAISSGGSASEVEGFFTSSLDTADGVDQSCPNEKTLYYHWGPEKRVASWLSAVRYDPAGPAQPVTSPMMQALLSTSDEEALLGSGLYLADSPFDTVRYGNELVIFSVTKASSSPACRWVPSQVLPRFVAADAAGKVKLAEGLGPFVAYRPISFGIEARQPTYYLLRRFPSPADKLNVTIGLAKSDDVTKAWAEFFKTNPTALRFMHGSMFHAIAESLEATNDPKKAMVAESKAFLWRLVADQVIPEAVTRGLNKADTANFGKICTLIRDQLKDSPGAKACATVSAAP